MATPPVAVFARSRNQRTCLRCLLKACSNVRVFGGIVVGLPHLGGPWARAEALQGASPHTPGQHICHEAAKLGSVRPVARQQLALVERERTKVKPTQCIPGTIIITLITLTAP